MKKKPFKAIILAGGSGERFWPISTPEKPKQFLTLFGGRSLIAQTFDRLRGIVDPAGSFVITSKALVALTRRELPDLPRSHILGEPVRRDTGAAVALGVNSAAEDDSEVLGFFPSDHLVADVPAFRKVVKSAIALARKEDSIVVIGIRPTAPSTAFGYIDPKRGKFVEKPCLAKARRYLKRGYLWNAGMFIARASVFKSAFARVAPALAAVRLADYPGLPRISFDYAVMEKIGNIRVLPGDFGWDDVGGYPALEKHFPVDASGNVLLGDARQLHSRNVSVVSRGLPVTVLGASDLVVVSTPTQLFVVGKSALGRMKELTEG